MESQGIGCVLGKGGETINEMRRSTGAHIRVQDKRDLPGCAGKDEALIAVYYHCSSMKAVCYGFRAS